MGLLKKKRQTPWTPKGLLSWPTTHVLPQNSPVKESAVSALLVKIRKDVGADQ